MQYPVLGYARHRCLVLPADAEFAVPTPEGDRFVCREVHLDELAPLTSLPESNVRARDLAQARAEGHYCIGVFAGEKLVSFSLNSLRPFNVMGTYQLYFPEGWIYHYMAVTLPEWRGRRLHGQQIAALRQSFAGGRFKGIVSLVLSMNYGSLASFFRLGFQEIASFHVIGEGRKPKLVAPRLRGEFAFAKSAEQR